MATSGRHFKPQAGAPGASASGGGAGRVAPGTPGSGRGGARAAHAPRPAQPVRPGQAPRAGQPAMSSQVPHSVHASRPQAYRPAHGARAEAPAPVSPAPTRRHASAPRPASQGGGGLPPRSNGARRRGTTAQPPRRSRSSLLSYALIGIGVVLLLAAGFLFVRAQMGYQESANYYDGLGNTALTDDEGKGVPKVDFAALKAECADVTGWIYIPGTKVNYMVVQGETNDTYLRHLPSGEYNMGGSIFLDSDNTAPGAVDQQTTIYGHHMNDGSMFEFVDQTLQQDVFDTVDEVYYITEGTTYVYKPLFTMQVPDDYLDARKPNFESPDAFRKYLQASLAQAKAHAKDAGAEVEKAERVLTLVTCAGEIIPRTTRAGMVCTLVDSYEN